MTKGEIQNLPAGKKSSSMYMELTKTLNKSKMFIHNIRAVEEFSDKCVLLKLPKGFIKISGEALCLSIYENTSVEIKGTVFMVEFV